MASASSLLSEEQFLCYICLDVFTDHNPVTTPCGQDYCRTCVAHSWDTSDVCQCPFCKETFDTVSTSSEMAEIQTAEVNRKPGTCKSR